MNDIKTLNVAFSKEEYNRLLKVKGSKSWHDLVMSLCLNEKEKESEKHD